MMNLQIIKLFLVILRS